MVFSAEGEASREEARKNKAAKAERPSKERMREMSTRLAHLALESPEYTKAFEKGDDTYPIPFWKGTEWGVFVGEFPNEHQHMMLAEDLAIVTDTISSETGYGCIDGRGGCFIHFQTPAEQKDDATKRIAELIVRGITNVEDDKKFPTYIEYNGPSEGEWARLKKNYPLGYKDVELAAVEAEVRKLLKINKLEWDIDPSTYAITPKK